MQFERSIEEFVVWNASQPVPPIEGPRALLKAQLNYNRSSRAPTFQSWRIAYGSLALAAASVFALAVWPSLTGSVAAASPDPSHTPGATVPVTISEVCLYRDLEAENPVPASLAERVFRKYGIADPKPRHYEVDYLITPALGGAQDVRNLWPQPYDSGVWNSRVKDALEDRLHDLVCSGRMDLAEAQQKLARDWVSAYKEYFQTSDPLPEHSRFVRDRAWE